MVSKVRGKGVTEAQKLESGWGNRFNRWAAECGRGHEQLGWVRERAVQRDIHVLQFLFDYPGAGVRVWWCTEAVQDGESHRNRSPAQPDLSAQHPPHIKSYSSPTMTELYSLNFYINQSAWDKWRQSASENNCSSSNGRVNPCTSPCWNAVWCKTVLLFRSFPWIFIQVKSIISRLKVQLY